MNTDTAASIAEEVVKRQLDAYNAKDIDSFMATWADDALYFEHPSTLLANGAAEIRARHIARFKEPDLYGRLIKRTVLKNKVIDIEIVSRTFPEGPGQVEVVCIYEVENYKIVKAWFILGAPILDAKL